MGTFKEIDMIDPKEAFDLAIAKGLLSLDESKDNYAGNYMYMYSKDDVHYFKNIDSRKYIY